MKFLKYILLPLLLLLTLPSLAQTPAHTVVFTWVVGASSSMPSCSTMTIDNITNPVQCSSSTDVVCESNEVFIETNSTFSAITQVLSQTLGSFVETLTIPAPANSTSATVNHYYAVSETGRDANNNQCFSLPATTSVPIPPSSTSVGQPQPAPGKLSGVYKQ